MFITSLYANANNEFSSFAEQDTVRLNQTVVSTPPVAVVEGFKIVLREQRISRGKNQFSKMRLDPLDDASKEKMNQKVDIIFDVSTSNLLEYMVLPKSVSIKLSSLSCIDYFMFL